MFDWVGTPENGYMKFSSNEPSEPNKPNEYYYEFKATRLKDSESKKESLKLIVCRKNSLEEESTEKVTVVISMRNLETGLADLCDYGVIFSDANRRLKLKRKIESVYQEIPIEIDKEFGQEEKERFKNFLVQVNERLILNEKVEEIEKKEGKVKEEKEIKKIREIKEIIRAGLFHMPLNIFDELAISCGYKEFELPSLKKRLKTEKVIKTDTGRCTKLVHYINKPVRTIAFDIEKVKAMKK